MSLISWKCTWVSFKSEYIKFVTLDIRDHVRHIEKAVSTKEPRFMSRTLRALVTTRRNLNSSVLLRAITGYYPSGQTPKVALLDYLDEVCVAVCHFKLNVLLESYLLLALVYIAAGLA